MTKLIINGHHNLKGNVQLTGDQRTVMAIQAACLLVTQGTMIIDKVPNTEKINCMNRLLEAMNVKVDFKRRQQILKMDATCSITPVTVSGQALLVSGALLARCHRVKLVENGINEESRRQMNVLCNGFQAMGATITKSNEELEIATPKLTGQNIDLQFCGPIPTMSLIMAATLAQGITVLKNPDHSSAVVELAKVLNKMGARVHGAGTETIRIQGVTFLHSTDYLALNDQEEAGFYLILGAATAGDILVHGAHQEHLTSLLNLLENMGNTVIVQQDGIRIIGTRLLLANDIDISAYQQNGKYVQMAILGLLLLAHGEATVSGIDDDLLNIIRSLIKDDGNQMQYCDSKLIIKGPIKHYPLTCLINSVSAGVLSLVMALASAQTTTIDPAEVINSSFTNLVDKLVDLGAQIDLSFD